MVARPRRLMVGWFALLVVGFMISSGAAMAQSPYGSGSVWVPPRIDVIGPLGNRLPPSYRRTYNRPTYVGGKIAHLIEPTSQEAMAWENANQLGLYDNNGVKGLINGQHCPPQRVTQHYFYPKPWESLQIGPRRPSGAATEANQTDAAGEAIPAGSVDIDLPLTSELPVPR